MEYAEEKNISRREFLKTTGVSTLVFLAELGFSKKAIAKLEKILKERPLIEKSFAGGIRSLEKEVKTNPLERMWVFVEKGESRGWIDIAEIATEEQVTSIDLKELLEDKKLTKLQFAHTHPLAVYKKLLHPDALASGESANGKIPIPPSPNDILVAFRYQKLIERKRLSYPVLHSVVEPSGVWNIEIDRKHDFAWRVGAILAEDEDPIALFLEFTQNYREKCDKILWGWSVPQTGFNAEKAIPKFQEWVLKEYGIILNYKKREN